MYHFNKVIHFEHKMKSLQLKESYLLTNVYIGNRLQDQVSKSAVEILILKNGQV